MGLYHLICPFGAITIEFHKTYSYSKYDNGMARHSKVCQYGFIQELKPFDSLHLNELAPTEP